MDQQISEKLDRIIDLLEAIRSNTTDIASIGARVGGIESELSAARAIAAEKDASAEARSAEDSLKAQDAKNAWVAQARPKDR